MRLIQSRKFVGRLRPIDNLSANLRCQWWSSQPPGIEKQQPAVKLYQYAICPFCNKVKAFLAYSGVEYEAIEVNPLTKDEIKWSKDYRKVPIATLDDKALLGSDAIIEGLLGQEFVASTLQDRWKGRSDTLDEFANSDSAKKWSEFANDDLAALLYPNMSRTWSDSYKAFAYVNEVPNFTPFQKLAIRSVGSFAMYMAAGKVKNLTICSSLIEKRNITDEREALSNSLLQLETEGLSGDNIFLSGTDTPNMGDIAVFGTLRSIEGLPAHSEAVFDRLGAIPAWYNRMTKTIYP